jgi:hypothetical protein
MAVFDFIPGLKVSIQVDDEDLDEYEDEAGEDEEAELSEVEEYQASRTVQRYIEATSGEEFVVYMALDKPFESDSPGIGFVVFVNGVQVNHTDFEREDWASESLCDHTVSGDVSGSLGKQVVRPFKFSKIGKSQSLPFTTIAR